jgi:hypothetical protein
MSLPNGPTPATPPGSHPDRVCLFGANGQLAGKLAPWCREAAARGVTFYAADIVPEEKFTPAFTGYAGYFDLSRAADLDRLRGLARHDPFDLAYDATWPNAHLLNILNQEAFFRHVLVTKPFVAIDQCAALEALMSLSAFRPVREKFLGADHFGNKPGLTALLGSLPAAHEVYGRISRVLIIAAERRTVNDPAEVKRREALLGGMVPDLVSHAVLILQLLTPRGLMWRDGQGNYLLRLGRTIRPTTCVRAQMSHAALPNNVDTACIVEYRVSEELTLAREDGTPHGEPFRNQFYALVVCGKGLGADAGRDLKAVEVSFQGLGRPGIIDLETNVLNDVLTHVPGLRPPGEEERGQRGINRPMLELTRRWDEFRADEAFRTSLFQGRGLIWENMRVLRETLAAARPGDLPAYTAREEIHHFVNTHIGPANGFRYFGTKHGSGWPMKEPPQHLMRGEAVAAPIP